MDHRTFNRECKASASARSTYSRRVLEKSEKRKKRVIFGSLRAEIDAFFQTRLAPLRLGDNGGARICTGHVSIATDRYAL